MAMPVQDLYTVASFQHIGARAEQQDRVAVAWHDSAGLVALGDGLGGHIDGALAAQSAMDVAQEVFDADPLADAGDMFRRIVRTAHERIWAANQLPENEVLAVSLYGLDIYARLCPGTTCVLLHLAPDRATWTHLGDSRLYHFQDGSTVFHTRDHAFPEGGLSACLGAGFADTPALVMGSAKLARGDSLVLCSDGLWENLPNDDYYLGDMLVRHGVDHGVRRVAADARKRGGDRCDNISIVAVRLADARGPS